MFDLILDKVPRPYRRSARGAIIVSAFGHAVLGTAVVALSLLYGMGGLPKVPSLAPSMTAFVSAPPLPPPPPRAQPPTAVRPPAVEPSPNPKAAPIEAPAGIEPEVIAPPPVDGQPGGVEGGIVGGLVAEVAPPPPPSPPPPAPPPTAPRQPVRIGGTVVAPALVYRVEPGYPPLAMEARLEGMVILEAMVDAEGRVGNVKVLLSRGVILDHAAVEAVQQWRYAPLMLNGAPTPWTQTVMLNFALQGRKAG